MRSSVPASRLWLILALLILTAVLLRLWRLGYPAAPYFDEKYYDDAARSILAWGRDPNFMHPPLGKELIAVGMAVSSRLGSLAERSAPGPLLVFGFRFLGNEGVGLKEGVGRRAAPLAASILTLFLVYLLADSLFANRTVAILSSFLLAFDFLHFVQSRIAMLDSFLGLFILTGYLTFWLYLKGPRRPWGWLLACGACFGLAMACKWSALFAMLPLPAFLWLWGESQPESPVLVSVVPGPAAPQDPQLPWSAAGTSGATPGMRLARFAGRGMFFVLVAVLVYTLPFVPLIMKGKPVSQVARDMHQVLSFHYPRNPKDFSHPYLSPFWAWPTLVRPIWYFYESHFQGTVERVYGIIALGNPWFWWTFLACLLYTAFRVRKGHDRALALVFFGYLFQLAGWGIDLKGGFFYYMYPMVPFMAILVAWNLERWWRRGSLGKAAVAVYLALILGLFAWFFPLLTALPISKAWFNSCMWFPKHWI